MSRSERTEQLNLINQINTCVYFSNHSNGGRRVEAGKRGCGEMGSLHGLEGEHQVWDLHSVFPGDKISELIASVVLLTETRMPKSPLPLRVVLLLGMTWQ